MFKNLKAFIVICLLSITLIFSGERNLLAEQKQLACMQKNIWSEHEEGWFWYEDLFEALKRKEQKNTQKKEEKITKKSPQKKEEKKQPVSYVQLLKEIQGTLEELKARAVLFPTPENVATWMKAQLLITKMAGTFTQVASLVPVMYPELDIAKQIGGKSELGATITSYTKKKQNERELTALASQSAIVLIYRYPGCELCKQEVKQVIKLAKNYPFKTYSFYEGEPPEGMDRVKPLTVSLEKALNIKTFPTLFLFKDKKFYYIGAGFLGQPDIKNRILSLAIQYKWIQTEPLYLTEDKVYSPQEVAKMLKDMLQNKEKEPRNVSK